MGEGIGLDGTGLGILGVVFTEYEYRSAMYDPVIGPNMRAHLSFVHTNDQKTNGVGFLGLPRAVSSIEYNFGYWIEMGCNSNIQ